MRTIPTSVRFAGAALFLGFCSLILSAGVTQELPTSGQGLRSSNPELIRVHEIQTSRPFAFDVDADGVLWQGCAGELLACDTHIGKAWSIALPELRGHTLSSVLCFRGRIVILHEVCDHATVYDPSTGTAAILPLPGAGTNVWFGTVAGNKLLLFDRSDQGGVLILDSLSEPFRKIPAAPNHYPWSGMLMPDGRLLVGVEPARSLEILDLQREVIVDEIPVPNPDGVLTGSMIYDGILYAADSSGGRLLVYSLEEKRWLQPIPAPDHGRVYGYIGTGCQLGSCGYFCLSTYRFTSRVDNATGKLVMPPDAQLGVDGSPHHFLDRFLTFDARTKQFGYLVVPSQPDGTPVVCYSLARDSRVYITGHVIPFGPGRSPGPVTGAGDWLIWQPLAGK